MSVGLLERPLVVGLFWAVFTGQTTVCVNIAIFFELFWLDLIPVGTYIPPHLTAATFAALSLTTFFDYESPARVLVIMFASMPLAWLGAKLEALLREQEQGSYNALLHWSRRSRPASGTPGKLVTKALARTCIFSFVTFYLYLIVLKFTLQTFFSCYPGLMSSVHISWAHMWVAATVGGLMALKFTRVYGVLAAGAVLVSLTIAFSS